MRVLENVSQTFWEDVSKSCSYATFFHTVYWSKLMEKTFSCINITKGFIFDDGTRAVLPLVHRKRRALKGFMAVNDCVSGFPYVYGGPIADRKISEQQLGELSNYISTGLRKYHTILIRGNPYGPNMKPIDFKEVKDCSQVVELSKCTEERDLLKQYHRLSRECINKAKKAKILQVKIANSLEDYKELYEIYKKSFKYWGKSVLTNYPLALFQNSYELKCEHTKLWATYYKNQMIGGDLTLYWNDYATLFLSYFDREHSKLDGRRYMQHNVLIDSISKGIKYYDFLQSGGVKGAEFYKYSMGGREYPHSAWIKENSIYSFMNKLREVKNSAGQLFKGSN